MNDTNKTIDFYSKYSSQYEEKISTLKNYDESYTGFVKQAKRNSNLLDLACGPANVSAFIKKIKPEIEITCVDLSDKMLEIAKNKLGRGHFYKSDILNITIPEKEYDMIICAFGIPYIKKHEVETFVNQLKRFSQKDTAVYVSCMEGDKISNEIMGFAGNKELTVQRHQKEAIISVFEKSGFTLTDYKSQDYKEPDESITTDMIFYFEKN